MKMEMDMKMETFGVVPSQDDLEWVWEDLQDGVLLQDLLLCSVLQSPQKPSAVFVETPENVNSGYEEDEVTMDMNEWYTNMEMNYGSTIPPNNNNAKTPMVPQQNQSTNVLAINDMSKNTVTPTYNEYNYHYHQNYTQEMKNDSTPMEYMSTASSATAIPQNITVQSQPHFLPENEVAAYLNSNFSAPSTTNTEVDQHEMYRSGVNSVYSNSSWESFADDSSHTTELSQEEIFEEIQRECAEIERKSMSPKMQKSRNKKSRSSRKVDAEERKKELNRVAAAKYREKKRIEREGKTVELEKLESRNRKLLSQASGLENEIKYLRELIKEIRERKGEF